MLLYFYGDDCPHCEQMNKVVDRLVAEDFPVERLEVFNNKENEVLMVSCDKKPCGGVPFLFNTETEKWICGESGYLEARALAIGE